MRTPVETIYCPPELRAEWPRPLAAVWKRQYPQVFGSDDLRLVLAQPRYHLPEWFTAIHLFHRKGALCLVQKYAYQNHLRKREVLRRLLSPDQLAALDEIRESQKVQPPDFFVFTRDGRFWFAEAKGPGDRLSARQVRSHCFVAERFGVPVEVFRIRIG